jgi:hypothetical protein
MKLPVDIADRAFRALGSGPLRADELYRRVWPERSEAPLAAQNRGGHNAGRDQIERGWGIQLPDGRYALAEQAEPDEALHEHEPAPLAYENGNVVEVHKRVIGPMPLPQPRTPRQAHQPQPPVQTTPQPQRYAPPQPTYAQFCQWQTTAMEPEVRALHTLAGEAFYLRAQDGTPLDEWGRAQRLRTIETRFQALLLDMYWWFRALGQAPIPYWERLSASSPPAPARLPSYRSPTPSYAPSYGW